MAGPNIAKFADLGLENYLKCVIKTIAHADEPQATTYPAITRQSALGWRCVVGFIIIIHQRSPVRMSVITSRLGNLPRCPESYSLPPNKIDGFTRVGDIIARCHLRVR